MNTKCLYCDISLDGKGQEPNAPSLEHIIPQSLGGVNFLSTKQCCKRCNNELGSSVDADFTNSFVVLAARQRCGMTKKNGKPLELPFPFKHDTNSGVSYISGTGIRTEFEKKVEFVNRDDGSTDVAISGSMEFVENTLFNKYRKNLQKKGTVNIDEKALLKRVKEDIRRNAKPEEIQKISSKIQIDLDKLDKGLLKIALGVGQFYLGEDFTCSQPAANMRLRLRNKLSICSKSHWQELRTDFWQTMFTDSQFTKNDHLVCVFPVANKIQICISLFGEGLLSNCYQIDLSHSMHPHQLYALRLCPISRKIRKLDFSDTSIFSELPEDAKSMVQDMIDGKFYPLVP